MDDEFVRLILITTRFLEKLPCISLASADEPLRDVVGKSGQKLQFSELKQKCHHFVRPASNDLMWVRTFKNARDVPDSSARLVHTLKTNSCSILFTLALKSFPRLYFIFVECRGWKKIGRGSVSQCGHRWGHSNNRSVRQCGLGYGRSNKRRVRQCGLGWGSSNGVSVSHCFE